MVAGAGRCLIGSGARARAPSSVWVRLDHGIMTGILSLLGAAFSALPSGGSDDPDQWVASNEEAPFAAGSVRCPC